MGVGEKFVPPGAEKRGLLTNEEGDGKKIAQETVPVPEPSMNTTFVKLRNAGKLPGASQVPQPEDKTHEMGAAGAVDHGEA